MLPVEFPPRVGSNKSLYLSLQFCVGLWSGTQKSVGNTLEIHPKYCSCCGGCSGEDFGGGGVVFLVVVVKILLLLWWWWKCC